MAAHAVYALSEMLAQTFHTDMQERQVNRIEEFIDQSITGNQVSLLFYDETTDWLKLARKDLESSVRVSADVKEEFRKIIWRELARLLPTWVMLGEPRNYEQWYDAIEFEAKETKELRQKLDHFLVDAWAVMRDERPIINIVRLRNLDQFRVRVDTGSFSDWPILYDNGTVAYDAPSRIPRYIKEEVKQTLKQVRHMNQRLEQNHDLFFMIDGKITNGLHDYWILPEEDGSAKVVYGEHGKDTFTHVVVRCPTTEDCEERYNRATPHC